MAEQALTPPVPMALGSRRVSTAAASALREYALAATLYAALILLMARQLLAAPADSIPVANAPHPEALDFLNVWALSWALHALRTSPTDLFHANIYYPEPFTLAFGEHLLGLLPLFAPLQLLTGSAMAAFNTYYLLSFVLTGLATYALARYWGLSFPAALFAGMAFAFAPPRLAQHFHTQLLAIWWIPLTLLLTERFLRRPTPGRAALMAAAFALQWLSSIYLGWFLTIALAVYLLCAVVAEPSIATRTRVWLYGLPAVGAAVLVVLPTLLPYLAVAERWSFNWSLDEVISHSTTPAHFLIVSPVNVLYRPLLAAFDETGGQEAHRFLGVALPLLALVGAAWGLRLGAAGGSRSRGLRWLTACALALLVVSLLLSFGPHAGLAQSLIPLPYLALYEWVPGFAAMRNPGRFIFLAALGLALLGALGMECVLRRVGPRRLGSVAVLLLLVLGAEQLSVLAAERLPAADGAALAYLRETAADGPIVELPISRDREVPEKPRMFASLAHWRPMLNGRSSFRPPSYEEVAATLQTSDPWVVADALQMMGIRTVVLHLDQLIPAEQRRYASSEWTQAGFGEVLRTDRTLIWRLEPRRPPTSAAVVEAELRMPRQTPVGELLEARLLLLAPDGQVYYDQVGGVRPLRGEWLPLDSESAPFAQQLAVPLPRLVVSKPQVKAEFKLLAPSEPGRYRVVLTGEHFSVERPVVVTSARRSAGR